MKTTTIHAQQKWEYQCLTRKSETYLNKELNELGQHGWELTSVIFGKDTKGTEAWIAFLKRPFAGHAAAAPGEAGESHAGQAAESAQAGGTRPTREFAMDGEEFEIQGG